MPEIFKWLVGNDFRVRVLSSIVVAPPALVALWVGGLLLFQLVALLLVLALYEWVRIAAPRDRRRILYLSSLLVLALVFVWSAVSPVMWHLPLILLFGGVWIWFLAKRSGCDYPLIIALGAPYLSLSLVGLGMLQDQDPLLARELIFYIVLVVWAVDTGAYFSGKLIGGPKLAPRWSPGKTWAGLVGGALVAGLAGGAWELYAEAQCPMLALALGVALGIIAQGGDLGESVLKRTFGVKDSGAFLPGHGGVLDRIDGFLLALPCFALFHYTLGAWLAWW